jgi:hypothetical protein
MSKWTSHAHPYIIVFANSTLLLDIVLRKIIFRQKLITIRGFS